MTRVRVALLSAAALGGALLLSGCGAGQISQTAGMQPAVPGANSTPGTGVHNSIQLRNVMFVYPGVDGYRQGANAPLQLHIFNIGQKPVRLIRVETDAASAVTMQNGPVASGNATPSPGGTAAPRETVSPFATRSATPSGSPSETPSGSPTETRSAVASASPGGGPVNVTVPVGGFVTLSPSTGGTLQLEGLTRPIRSGESATIRFVFDNGAEYSLDVPVGLPSAPAPKGSPAAEEGGGE